MVAAPTLAPSMESPCPLHCACPQTARVHSKPSAQACDPMPPPASRATLHLVPQRRQPTAVSVLLFISTVIIGQPWGQERSLPPFQDESPNNELPLSPGFCCLNIRQVRRPSERLPSRFQKSSRETVRLSGEYSRRAPTPKPSHATAHEAHDPHADALTLHSRATFVLEAGF